MITIFRLLNFKNGFFILVVFVLHSCAPYMHQPLKPQRARLGPETPQKNELTSLPAPKDKIVAAVYKFRDQTGQYKPAENMSSWSTAITQGTTTILLRALEESQWFIPIERENIGNLLNERKIIRSSRAQYAGQSEENSPLLPPLLFAGVILEGGIISYEANVLTGGMGLRYFGTGASGQYREDRVTVYLRAVSTSNGKILKTVYTTKSILSQQVDIGVFRYVKFKRLLEAETGFTYNEPSEMAVTEAIEKAVTSLIIEGAIEGLWTFANAADSSSLVVKQYQAEKNQNKDIDVFGRLLNVNNRGKVSLELFGGAVRIDGDYPSAEVRPLAGFAAAYMFNPSFLLKLQGERTEFIAGRNKYSTYANALKVGVDYLFTPLEKVSPFIGFGLGAIKESGATSYAKDPITGLFYYEVGLEWLMSSRFGINASASHNIMFNDGFDGVNQGKYPDMYWTAKLGLTYYLGKHKVRKVPLSKP